MNWDAARNEAMNTVLCDYPKRLAIEQNVQQLPESCYSFLQTTGEIIIIKRGESGYYRTAIAPTDKNEAQGIVDEYNSRLGVTKAQEKAMTVGSMFGWDVPGADPRNYDELGALKQVDHQTPLNEQIVSAQQKQFDKGTRIINVPNKEEVR